MDHEATIMRVAEVAPDSALAADLERRSEIFRLSQAAQDAVLTPTAAGGLSHAERAALACRMARINADDRLAGHYRATLEAAGTTDVLAAVCDPGTGVDAIDGARLKAIVRHVDLLTRTPRQATRRNIEDLKAAGIEEADIVRLSELIAFVNYQARVIAGLRLLGRTS